MKCKEGKLSETQFIKFSTEEWSIIGKSNYGTKIVEKFRWEGPLMSLVQSSAQTGITPKLYKIADRGPCLVDFLNIWIEVPQPLWAPVPLLHQSYEEILFPVSSQRFSYCSLHLWSLHTSEKTLDLFCLHSPFC